VRRMRHILSVSGVSGTSEQESRPVMLSHDEEIEGQQSIDDVTSEDAGQDPTLTREGDAPAADLTPEQASAELTRVDGEPESEPDPTDAPSAGQPAVTAAGDAPNSSSLPSSPSSPAQSHRFRIVHEIADLGSDLVHASHTSEPMFLVDAVKFLDELGELWL
jgi:hypothetical protein